MTNPAPYPPDTKPKGWRFELDYERIEQSDTWALAPAELRPWLLMLWFTAWKQTPGGSLPNDDALIAARIGMPMPMFTEHRTVLMRGWWQGDDGRLYHDTLTERVLDMLAKKEKDRLRQAEYRNRKRAVSKGVAPSSHVTNEGHTRDSDGVHWSHAGVTSPSTKHLNQAPESAYGTSTVLSAGEVVKAMRAEGIQKANPSNAKLIALLSAGVPLAVFVEAARIAAKSAEKNPFGWALSRIANRIESGEIDLDEGKPKPTPSWAINAGFSSIYEANNVGCYEHNAAQFRNGELIAEVAA